MKSHLVETHGFTWNHAADKVKELRIEINANNSFQW